MNPWLTMRRMSQRIQDEADDESIEEDVDASEVEQVVYPLRFLVIAFGPTNPATAASGACG